MTAKRFGPSRSKRPAELLSAALVAVRWTGCGDSRAGEGSRGFAGRRELPGGCVEATLVAG